MPVYLLIVILLVLFLSAGISLLLERSLVRAPFILSASLLLPVLLFDYQLDDLTYLTLASAVLAFSSGYYPWIMMTNGHGVHSTGTLHFMQERQRYYKRVIIFLFVIAQVAFLLNLSRVVETLGPSAYLTVSSKEIEMTFGKYTVVNYVYFLNMYVAALCVCYLSVVDHRKILYLVLALSLLSLLFMGIKSTFIFATCICIFVYLTVKKRSLKSIVALSLSMAVLVMALFAVVNHDIFSLGVGDRSPSDWVSLVGESVSNYVYYNYINLDLELAERSSYTYGKYTFFFVTKFFNPGKEGYFDFTDFILLDHNYNMGTFLREYFVDYGMAGALGIPFLLGNICAYVAMTLRATCAPRHVIFMGMLMTASAFAFFGNQFIRLQFIYIVMVAYLVDIAAHALGVMSLQSRGRLRVTQRNLTCVE